MPGYSSASETPSVFRVEKGRIEATLTLSNGTTVRGNFFIAGSSETHAGPERIKDVLNAAGFFPFEVAGPNGSRTFMYNRDHVVVAALPNDAEVHSDPGYNVATRRMASMLLSNGVRLHGTVNVYRPEGHDRLSDFARTPERFKYLEDAGLTYLVNVAHVVELLEEIPQP